MVDQATARGFSRAIPLQLVRGHRRVGRQQVRHQIRRVRRARGSRPASVPVTVLVGGHDVARQIMVVVMIMTIMIVSCTIVSNHIITILNLNTIIIIIITITITITIP